jgi:uncharacterized membrane protein (UPF0127 family)
LIRISSRSLPVTLVRIGDTTIFCEHPTSREDREKGLKGRTFLFDHKGMLFDAYGNYRPMFTMQDVPIDLEAIFVGNDMCVKDVIRMARLNGSTAYTTSLRVPIKWVIEVNAGFCSRNRIKAGDKVVL